MIAIVERSRVESAMFDRMKVDNIMPGELSDCWSLGCLLYELIVGDFLFETGDNWALFFLLLSDEKMGVLPGEEACQKLSIIGTEGIEKTIKLMKCCLQRNCERRLSASDLHRTAVSFGRT